MSDSWTNRLAVTRHGDGDAVVFLHGEDGLLFSEDLISRLAEHFTVHCPIAPGWSDHDLDSQQKSIGDLSYLYLDMLEGSFNSPVPVIGVSLGAWLALEICVKRRDVASRLGLVSPVGVGTSTDRSLDFVDIYAVSPAGVDQALYSAHGSRTRSDRAQDLDQDDLVRLARAEQSVAYYCWEPYFHNPQLAGLLHRVQLPTCVIYGTADRFVSDPSYHHKIGALLGENAQTCAIDGGGHRVFEESPEQVANALLQFFTLDASA
jgi:pimeloyl-ACP methyl ester carboxylesterase